MPSTEQHTTPLSIIEILKKGQQRLREHVLADSPLKDILTSLIAIVEEASPGLRGAVFMIKPGTNLLFKAVAPSLAEELFEHMAEGMATSGKTAPKGVSKFITGNVFTVDMAQDPVYADFYKISKKYGISACWTQQIVSKGKTIGVFSLFHDVNRTPLEDEIDLLDIVAGLAGMAVEIKNSEIALKESIGDQEKREEMLYFLSKASEELSATLDYSTTFDTIAKLIVPRLADWFSIDVLNDKGTFDSLVIAHKDPEKVKWVLEIREQYPPDMDAPTGSPNVIRTGKSEIYPEIPDELLVAGAKDERHLEIIRLIGFHSVMAVPLTAGGKTFGVISFVSTTESKRTYNEADLRLAEDFARRVALTIENVNLFKRAQEGQKRFETLVESLPQMAWTATPEGKVTFVNQRWHDYIGSTIDHIMDPSQYLHSDDLKRSSEHWAKAIKEGGAFTNESRFKRKSDGMYRWHLTRAIPLKNQNGDVILWIGTNTDIHEQKIAEEKLKEQNQYLEILNRVGKTISAELDISKIVQTVTDAATEISKAQFGAFFYNVINEKGEAFTLYTISGVPREAFSKFPMPRNTAVFHPTFHNSGVVRSDDITKDPRYGKNEPYYGMPAGHLPVKSYLAVSVVSSSGEVLGGLFFGHEKPGIFTDEAEQFVVGIASQAAIAIDNSRLFKASKESEERFRMLADVMPQMVWTTTANGDHDYFNQNWYDYTGLTYDETKDKGWSTVLHPDDYQRTLEIWTHSLKTGEPYEIEYRMKGKDSQYRWFLARALPLKGNNNEITRWFGTCTDIHDNKILEEEMRTVQAELEQRVEDRTIELSRVNRSLEKYNIELIGARELAEDANRAKSAFLSSMSHELRTPLNAILGFAQILKKDREIPEKQRSFVETMYKSGVHLLDMINDVLDISKIESGKMQLFPEIFDLTTLLEDVHEIFHQQAKEKELEFITDFPNPPLMVFADSKRIRQILINLLGNAVKFTSKGNITLAVNVKETFKKGDKQYSTIQFVVGDTGRGIAPEQHTMIFEPFRQSSDLYSEGTGLGLAISKRIAYLMGGEIQLKSNVGIGSTFTFTCSLELPIHELTRDIISRDSVVIGIKHREQQPKVLIVDDVESNRLVAKNFLEPIGFFCAEAHDGRSAIIIAEQFQPDIILLDLLMPIMNGYETLEKLRKIPELANIPIIAITASGFDGKRKEVLKAGFNEYIRKPFRAEEIFTPIATLLNIEYIYDSDVAETSQHAYSEDIKELTASIIDSINSLGPVPKNLLIEAIEIQDFEAIINILDTFKIDLTASRSFKRLDEAARTADFKIMAEITEKLRNIKNL